MTAEELERHRARMACILRPENRERKKGISEAILPRAL